MNIEKAIEQLRELREDRLSFIDGKDDEFTAPFKADVEAIDAVLNELDWYRSAQPILLHTPKAAEDIEKIVRHSNFITVSSDMMPKIEFINNWISCEDRLPIDKGPVLCYARSVTGEGYVYIIGLLRNGKFWFMQSDGELLSFPCLCLEVTHWMPLPEPPKTNDNEEE